MQPHAMIRKRLYERQLQTVREISIALGEKDSYTQAHGHRVANYAMRLAEREGFSPQGIREVGIGGLFHDVGKLALSDRIFTDRQTRLPNDLKQEVRCHPLIGAALLKNIDFLEPSVDFVLFHHEREDGKGYPFGLKAEEIPPGAKIISIADCFDAVTTDRPYHDGQPVESAFRILREGCRRYFYEAYVAAFIAEIEENGIILETGPDTIFADGLIQSAAGFSVM
jgi:HD-GYP domain-containing protein (c-di-GMP phosphodiesterase class II)